jgi:hypothetical protein
MKPTEKCIIGYRVIWTQDPDYAGDFDSSYTYDVTERVGEARQKQSAIRGTAHLHRAGHTEAMYFPVYAWVTDTKREIA